MIDLPQVKLRWRLKTYLDRNGKSSYLLARAMDGKHRTNETMLYRITDGADVRVTTENLERILTGIEKLGLQGVGLSDIVEEVK
jgi:hypothetical protein